MKKIFISCLLSLCLVKTFAQILNEHTAETFPDSIHIIPTSAWENRKVFALTANVNIRQSPSKEGKVIGKLAIGEAVNVEEVTYNTLLINGLELRWCKISLTQQGQILRGYVWGGFLTPIKIKGFGEKPVEYLAGFLDSNLIQIRAISNQKELSKVTLPFSYEFSEFSIKAKYSFDFDGVETIIVANVESCPCGCGGTTYLFFQQKEQLNKLLEQQSSGYEDMGHDGLILVPSDLGGLPKHIIVVETEFDETKDDNKPDHYQAHFKVYKWTGNKLILAKEFKY